MVYAGIAGPAQSRRVPYGQDFHRLDAQFPRYDHTYDLEGQTRVILTHSPGLRKTYLDPDGDRLPAYHALHSLHESRA